MDTTNDNTAQGVNAQLPDDSKHPLGHVLSHLRAYAETLEKNERINRREGHVEQANLEAVAFFECRTAIKVLKAFPEATTP